MRLAVVFALALLVLGGLGFFWLRTNGVRGGRAAPAPQEATTSLPSSQELAPVSLEPSPTRELGGQATQVPAEEAQPILEVSAGSTELSGTILGIVRGPSGRQLDGVRVRVVDAQGEAQDAEADPERYEARGLAAGHYWVSADARGHRTAYAEVELAAGGEERLDFELAEVVRLDVFVLGPDQRPLTLDRKPRVGAMVAVARLSMVNNWDAEIEGGAERHLGVGSFRPSDARAGEGGIGVLELDGEPPVWVHLCLGQKVLAVRRVELDEREVVFELAEERPSELGTLRVRALAANGTPLPIVNVSLSTGSGSVLVNGRGQERIEIADLAPGNYTLLVNAQSQAFQSREVIVRGGVQEVDVEVELAVRAQGRVLDAAGLPVGATERDEGDGAWVQLGRIGLGNAIVSWEDMRYLVDEEGRFSLSLAPGTYVLRAEFERALSSSLRIDLSHGPLEGIELVLLDPIELVLQREQGEWRGARYELRDEEGLTASEGSFRGPQPLVLHAAQGRYELFVELDGLRVHKATLVLENASVTHRFGW